MKYSFFLLSLTLLCTSCYYSKSEDGISFSTEEKGSDEIRKKEVKGEIDQISVAQSIEAELIKSDEEKVVVFAPENKIDDVVASLKNGVLELRMNQHFSFGVNSSQVRAKIYVKDFSALRASSSAQVFSKDEFLLNQLSMSASSSADIEGAYQANKMMIEVTSSGQLSGEIWSKFLKAKVSSSGLIDVKGSGEDAEIEASSSGFFDAKNLKVQDAKLRSSSSGRIEITVHNTADTRASSSGSIHLFTDGKSLKTFNRFESSSGSVTLH